jgi:hypothetical protein
MTYPISALSTTYGAQPGPLVELVLEPVHLEPSLPSRPFTLSSSAASLIASSCACLACRAIQAIRSALRRALLSRCALLSAGRQGPIGRSELYRQGEQAPGRQGWA